MIEKLLLVGEGRMGKSNFLFNLQINQGTSILSMISDITLSALMLLASAS